MRACFRAAAVAAVAALTFAGGRALAAPPERQDDGEAAVLAELNFARTHPQEYARQLLQQPESVWEAALRANGDTEDPGAYAEAVKFLMAQKPLPPLSSDAHLQSAAFEHTEEQGSAGAVGHESSTGERFDARLRRHGVEGAYVAENIAYGPPRPNDVVRELIIDRGVASRGHRRNIFNATLQTAGVKCGTHKIYGVMCTIDFASLPAQTQQPWREAALAPAARSAGQHWRFFEAP
jgi:uncharacterized protein YkwD